MARSEKANNFVLKGASNLVGHFKHKNTIFLIYVPKSNLDFYFDFINYLVGRRDYYFDFINYLNKKYII